MKFTQWLYRLFNCHKYVKSKATYGKYGLYRNGIEVGQNYAITWTETCSICNNIRIQTETTLYHEHAIATVELINKAPAGKLVKVDQG